MSAQPNGSGLPRRPSRPPPPGPPVRQRAAAASPTAAEEAALQGVIRTRKLWVRAAAGVVIVVCSTLIGAQFKTTKQEIDASKKITESAGAYTNGAGSPDAMNIQLPVEEVPIKQQPRQQQPSTKSTSGIALEIARQIASLEDRKMLLNRQKQTLEAKIDILRERMAKKQELEKLREASHVER